MSEVTFRCGPNHCELRSHDGFLISLKAHERRDIRAELLAMLDLDTFEGALKHAQGLAPERFAGRVMAYDSQGNLMFERAIPKIEEGEAVRQLNTNAKEFRDGEYRRDNDMPGAKPMSVTFGDLTSEDWAELGAKGIRPKELGERTGGTRMTTAELKLQLMVLNESLAIYDDVYQAILECIAAKEALDWIVDHECDVEGFKRNAWLCRGWMGQSDDRVLSPTPLAAIQKAMEGEK